mmetsp:Transcript_62706/g.167750  ORF Transcript_62706/g.167750 Transcript_62706/m.167750 type:complete len:468 (+) Transcript_62706:1-1404(+)
MGCGASAAVFPAGGGAVPPGAAGGGGGGTRPALEGAAKASGVEALDLGDEDLGELPHSPSSGAHPVTPATGSMSLLPAPGRQLLPSHSMISGTSCLSGEPPQNMGLATYARVMTDACVAAGMRSQVCVGGTTGGTKEAEQVEEEFAEKLWSCFSLEGAGQETTWRRVLAGTGVALSCRKGRKPGTPNQDNVFACQRGDLTIAGVADGHGSDGHWVSHWAVRYAAHLALSETVDMGEKSSLDDVDDVCMQRVFNLVHEALQERGKNDGFDLSFSGATLTLCFVRREAREVLVGWVGDSTCVLARSGAEVQVRRVTSDHKPGHVEERQRLKGFPGSIISTTTPARVRSASQGDPLEGEQLGLAVSRAVGDLELHKVGISHKPGVFRERLEAPEDGSADSDDDTGVLVMCSDGVWDMIAGEEVAAEVFEAGRENASLAAEAIAEKARERWLATSDSDEDTDDISVVVVWL